jgi:hypothetical protein
VKTPINSAGGTTIRDKSGKVLERQLPTAPTAAEFKARQNPAKATAVAAPADAGDTSTSAPSGRGRTKE